MKTRTAIAIPSEGPADSDGVRTMRSAEPAAAEDARLLKLNIAIRRKRMAYSVLEAVRDSKIYLISDLRKLGWEQEEIDAALEVGLVVQFEDCLFESWSICGQFSPWLPQEAKQVSGCAPVAADARKHGQRFSGQCAIDCSLPGDECRRVHTWFIKENSPETVLEGTNLQTETEEQPDPRALQFEGLKLVNSKTAEPSKYFLYVGNEADVNAACALLADMGIFDFTAKKNGSKGTKRTHRLYLGFWVQINLFDGSRLKRKSGELSEGSLEECLYAGQAMAQLGVKARVIMTEGGKAELRMEG